MMFEAEVLFIYEPFSASDTFSIFLSLASLFVFLGRQFLLNI